MLQKMLVLLLLFLCLFLQLLLGLGDGFLDPDDQCPTVTEVFNSYLDSDGCPDEVPGDLIEFAGAIPAIQFQVGSARLKRSALPILDKAALDTVRRAAPFPAIPDGAGRSSWPFTVPLAFSR